MKKSEMVEQQVMVEVGGGVLSVPSSVAPCPMPLQATPANYYRYPPALATYEEVVASPTLFMETLEKVHAAMGTKFMIPTVGGRDLDLHRLFVEATSRGGITKILGERKWKDVIGAFSFPSSATNASFVLRKYYFSLLHHYEQIYFLNAKGWSPEAADALPFSPSTVIPRGRIEPARSSPITQANKPHDSSTWLPKVSSAASKGSEVYGVIDGKFESGYLITVKIGLEEYKGVLYHSPMDPSRQVTQLQSNQQPQSISAYKTKSSGLALGVSRRKRRKKSEIKKRDPAHPKPNRSGYNFFFAVQHARLKPLYPGKDREISRMIGESWNKLQEPERAIYQEKAARDKERYKMEMEQYRERLRTGLPIRQQPLCSNLSAAMDVDTKLETIDETSSRSPENVTISNKNDRINTELTVGQAITEGSAMQQKTLGPDLNLMDLDKKFENEDAPDTPGEEGCPALEKAGKVEVSSRGTLSNEGVFEVQKRAEMDGNEDMECSGDTAFVNDEMGLPSDRGGISTPIKGLISAPGDRMEALTNKAQEAAGN